MERIPIYICGFPRSGNSWLSWLLGDLLDSPVGRWGPALPLSTEGGPERKGNFVIHQLHLHVEERIAMGEAVQDAWTFAPKCWNGERIVSIVRDPRAVAVSAMHYWDLGNLAETMASMSMGTGPFNGVGSWNQYYRGWMPYLDTMTYRMSYEGLCRFPVQRLQLIASLFGGMMVTEARVQETLARQSIEAKRKQVAVDGDTRPYGREIQLKHLRKGDPDDWKNYFNDKLNSMAYELFGEVAHGLGYDLKSK